MLLSQQAIPWMIADVTSKFKKKKSSAVLKACSRPPVIIVASVFYLVFAFITPLKFMTKKKDTYFWEEYNQLSSSPSFNFACFSHMAI